MNTIEWEKVTYKLKGAIIAPGDLKYYYHNKIEIEIWLDDQLIGHTNIEDD